jgi:hypothetical protein
MFILSRNLFCRFLETALNINDTTAFNIRGVNELFLVWRNLETTYHINNSTTCVPCVDVLNRVVVCVGEDAGQTSDILGVVVQRFVLDILDVVFNTIIVILVNFVVFDIIPKHLAHCVVADCVGVVVQEQKWWIAVRRDDKFLCWMFSIVYGTVYEKFSAALAHMK